MIIRNAPIAQPMINRGGWLGRLLRLLGIKSVVRYEPLRERTIDSLVKQLDARKMRAQPGEYTVMYVDIQHLLHDPRRIVEYALDRGIMLIPERGR